MVSALSTGHKPEHVIFRSIHHGTYVAPEDKEFALIGATIHSKSCSG
jgi:hypothetical protein